MREILAKLAALESLDSKAPAKKESKTAPSTTAPNGKKKLNEYATTPVAMTPKEGIPDFAQWQEAVSRMFPQAEFKGDETWCTAVVNERMVIGAWDGQEGNIDPAGISETVDESYGEEETCPNCNGSGEGMHEGQRCDYCGGSGTVSAYTNEPGGPEYERDMDEDLTEYKDSDTLGGPKGNIAIVKGRSGNYFATSKKITSGPQYTAIDQATAQKYIAQGAEDRTQGAVNESDLDEDLSPAQKREREIIAAANAANARPGGKGGSVSFPPRLGNTDGDTKRDRGGEQAWRSGAGAKGLGEEQVDELSPNTLKSYIDKALDPRSEKSISNLASRSGYEYSKHGDETPSAGEKDDKKAYQRSKGVNRAIKRLTREDGVAQASLREEPITEKSKSEKQARFMAAAAHDPKFAKKVRMKQDVAKEFNKADTGTKQLSQAMKHKKTNEEQVNELSPSTLGSYVKKASKDAKSRGYDAGAADWSGDEMQKHPDSRTWPGRGQDAKAHNRLKGIDRAVDKLTTDEGIGDTIKKGVKQVKRGLQGWDKSFTGTPAELVKRNKAYDTDTAKMLRGNLDKDSKWTNKHSPQGLQHRVLDRKLKNTTESKNMKPTTIVLEGMSFRVQDPHLAKVLRHFPKEVTDFNMGEEIDDHLYNALYDFYFDEMPYGTKKARDGDPYEWVSNRLAQDLNSQGHSVMHPADMPTEGAAGDIMPMEASDNDEQYACTYCGREVPPGVEPSMFDCCGERGHVDPIDELDEALSPEQMRAAQMRSQQRMAGQAAPGAPKPNPFGDTKRDAGGEQAWRAQAGAKGLGEELEEEDMNEAFLVEENEGLITSVLEDMGLDHGLDFFFDNGLVAIGRSTAKVIISALKNDPRIKGMPAIASIDGEEVQITFDKQARPTGPDLKVDDIPAADFNPDEAIPQPMRGESAMHSEATMNEEVSMNITAQGEDDVVNIIRKLSGLGNDAASAPAQSAQSTMQSMPSMLAHIDSAQDEQPEEEVRGFEVTSDEPEMEESEYANEPDPTVHTSTTDMINQGNDLNRPKRQNYPRRNPGDNPMAETRGLMKQYEAMKNSIKK